MTREDGEDGWRWAEGGLIIKAKAERGRSDEKIKGVMNSQVYNCNEQCQSWADGYDDVWENMIMDGGLLESINVSDDGRVSGKKEPKLHQQDGNDDTEKTPPIR